ncbi:MAG: hypothetical protein R3C19_02560 [Planctomycetaceae bacterium]
MTTDAFRRRESALEEEFFHRVDEELKQKLKEKWRREADREELKANTHIMDGSVLDELLDAGIRPQTVQALNLFPTVHVAWATGSVVEKEKEAVHHAAKQAGLDPDSEAWHVLDWWLHQRPPESLLKAWKDYIHALKDVVPPDTFAALKRQTVAAARDVAEAAGGFLGLLPVSAAEHKAIDELGASFDGD